jgi:hypothetical protein
LCGRPCYRKTAAPRTNCFVSFAWDRPAVCGGRIEGSRHGFLRLPTRIARKEECLLTVPADIIAVRQWWSKFFWAIRGKPQNRFELPVLLTTPRRLPSGNTQSKPGRLRCRSRQEYYFSSTNRREHCVRYRRGKIAAADCWGISLSSKRIVPCQVARSTAQDRQHRCAKPRQFATSSIKPTVSS